MTEIACQYRTLILHGLALVMHRKCGKECLSNKYVYNFVCNYCLYCFYPILTCFLFKVIIYQKNSPPLKYDKRVTFCL